MSKDLYSSVSAAELTCIRVKYGATKTEFASFAKVDRSMYSRWERGVLEPLPQRVVLRIREAIGGAIFDGLLAECRQNS